MHGDVVVPLCMLGLCLAVKFWKSSMMEGLAGWLAGYLDLEDLDVMKVISTVILSGLVFGCDDR